MKEEKAKTTCKVINWSTKCLKEEPGGVGMGEIAHYFQALCLLCL